MTKSLQLQEPSSNIVKNRYQSLELKKNNSEILLNNYIPV
jgi:hypothetical protein